MKEHQSEVQICDDGICTLARNAADAVESKMDGNYHSFGVIADRGGTHQEIEARAKKTSKSEGRRNKNEKESSTDSSPIVTTLHSEQDVNAFLSANDAVIIEFMTTWCGACKSIEEYYIELSKSNEVNDIKSAKVNCDKNKQTKKLAASYNVKSYPVFVAFKSGTISHRFDGADKGKLESTFERLGGGGGKNKKRGGRSKKKG